MKNQFTFIKIISIVLISAILIFLLKPYVNEYKERKTYDFTLDSLDGKINKDDFKGKVLAVYFGYTLCPDVCPTSLSTLSQALNQLNIEKDDLSAVFVSVDPQRDSLQNLNEYAKYFHQNFIGASSNKEYLDDMTKRYGSYYEKVILKDSAMDYSVSHTSYIYIFDKNGKFVSKIDHFSNPEKIAKILKEILS